LLTARAATKAPVTPGGAFRFAPRPPFLHTRHTSIAALQSPAGIIPTPGNTRDRGWRER
jgi:hypothetical protein